MNRSPRRLGYVVVAVILLALLAAVGLAWWFFMGQYTTAATPPASPVQVFLLSPASGGDVQAGDYVPIDLQAVAPTALSWSEVFVDGISLGAVRESPERASWTWQAWPAGVHVLAGRSQAADGQLGESQTVIVNVVGVDGTMQVLAGPSETLAQVGAKFGASSSQMAGANPQLSASKPLGPGQPVNVPTDNAQPSGGGAPPGSGNGPGGGVTPIYVQWELKLSGEVDKSYCYISDGSGAWDKMPKQPFEFFGGLVNLYTQVLEVVPPSEGAIQAQCWGWLGGVLKYLGQGEAKSAGKGPIQVNGSGFQLVGILQVAEDKGGPTEGDVTPPFALREAASVAECSSHEGTTIKSALCASTMTAPVKQYVVLVWEWQPELCWPGYCKYDINAIDGYMVYEADPISQASTYFLKQVSGANRKMAAIPLPWGAKCYLVTALAGGKESEPAKYCPGQAPGAQKLTLTELENWVTAVDRLTVGDECDAQDDAYFFYGKGVGEVFAGAYNYDSNYTDCYDNVYYTGAVKFKMALAPLPNGAVVQKAILRFKPIYKWYTSSNTAYYGPESCVSYVGKATKSWTGLVDPDHWIGLFGLASYGSPTVSVPDAGPIGLNVTSIVSDWVAKPGTQHGFMIYGDNFPGGNPAYCISGLANFELDIYYLTP